MKNLILLALLLVSNIAFAHDQMTFMKPGTIWCFKEFAGSLEDILDASSQIQAKANAASAIFSGKCMLSKSALEVANIEKARSRGGRPYACFLQISEESQQKFGPYCSPQSGITTIKSDVSKRKGDYKIVGEGEGGIKAECAEGGAIMIQKKGEHGRWQRISLLFPLGMDQPIRSIPADRETALRNGCKGLDYIGHTTQSDKVAP